MVKLVPIIKQKIEDDIKKRHGKGKADKQLVRAILSELVGDVQKRVETEESEVRAEITAVLDRLVGQVAVLNPGPPAPGTSVNGFSCVHARPLRPQQPNNGVVLVSRAAVGGGGLVDFAGGLSGAIVNSALNSCLAEGDAVGSLDAAVADAGGAELHAARAALPLLAGAPGANGYRCATGSAVTTVGGGSLLAARVIHAVAPTYLTEADDPTTPEDNDESLVDAYSAAMAQGRSEHVTHLAFPCSLLRDAAATGPARTLEEVVMLGARTICAGLYPELVELHLVATR